MEEEEEKRRSWFDERKSEIQFWMLSLNKWKCSEGSWKNMKLKEEIRIGDKNKMQQFYFLFSLFVIFEKMEWKYLFLNLNLI